MAKSDETPKDGSAAAVQFKWGDSTALPIHAVEQLHVQVVQGRIYLTFGQLNLPVMVEGPPPGFKADVRPVARLMVLPHDFETIVRTMQTVVDASGKPKKG
jgi:hypothetical protein